MPRRFGQTATDSLRGPDVGVFSGRHSYSIWFYKLGAGGDTGGFIGFRHTYAVEGSGGDTVLQIFRGFTPTNGAWTVAMPSSNVWHNLIITYTDIAADDPIVYIDGLSVSVTEISTPSGTIDSMVDPLCLGNKVNDNSQNFDGYLAEFALWHNRILSKQEAYQIGRARKSPLFFRHRLISYAPLSNGRTISENEAIFQNEDYLDIFPSLKAIELFDGYTTGVDLDGLSGGDTWSTAWDGVDGSGTPISGHKTIETAPAGGQGGKAVRANTTTESHYIRTFSPLAAGSVKWRMRISITNPNDAMGVVLRAGVPPSNGHMYCRFGPTGNIEYYDHDLAAYQTIQAYSIDTWYLCEIQFDDVSQPNKYRVRIDNGAWTSWVTVNSGSYTTINYIDLDTSATNAHTMWYDDISVNVTPTRPTTVLDTLDIVRPTALWRSAEAFQTAAALSPFISVSNINFFKNIRMAGY